MKRRASSPLRGVYTSDRRAAYALRLEDRVGSSLVDGEIESGIQAFAWSVCPPNDGGGFFEVEGPPGRQSHSGVGSLRPQHARRIMGAWFACQ